MFKTERMSAFSDGVIAIAITLLVLNIEVPSAQKVAEQNLVSYLLQSIDSMLGFLSSFILIGTYWLMHYVLFHFITRADRYLVALNALFLLIVSFIPFPTGLQAAYRDDEMAMAFYCGTQVLCGLSLLAIWIYASSHNLVRAGLPPRVVRGVARQVSLAPLISAFALVVSYVDIYLSRFVLLAIPIVFFNSRSYDNDWTTQTDSNAGA